MLKIRIHFDAQSWLGPGKIELLELIEAHGSISAAGRAMGMSYKRAWDLVAEMNRIFGAPVASAQSGGRAGGGAELTALGHALVEHYRGAERACGAAAARHVAALERLREPGAVPELLEENAMRISARNRLKGRIVEVVKGQTTAHVRLDVGGGIVTAAITNEAVDDLGLAAGMEAYAVVKASDVMIAVDE